MKDVKIPHRETEVVLSSTLWQGLVISLRELHFLGSWRAFNVSLEELYY